MEKISHKEAATTAHTNLFLTVSVGKRNFTFGKVRVGLCEVYEAEKEILLQLLLTSSM